MSYKNVVRAWKDRKYRESLSEAERAQLPPNPAGMVELTDADLGKVGGGVATVPCTQPGFCQQTVRFGCHFNTPNCPQ
jgi:mersacidin/lichenicidin family type 2 lantibiotic